MNVAMAQILRVVDIQQVDIMKTVDILVVVSRLRLVDAIVMNTVRTEAVEIAEEY